MRIISDLKLKEILKNWVFWLLILITGIAIIIRSLPAWINAAWGCDFGIYYGITKSVAQSGEIFPVYSGWGSSYNEFPVLYAINAFASWITGIDILTVMPKLTPIFGGLTVLIFYFVVRELTDNKKIAIVSTLLLSVLPFHVYQLSHASPLTMGHFFMMLSLYFFIKYRQKFVYVLPLFISTILLIMSHHLTTYFYLISLVFIVFFENASQDKWTYSIKRDAVYIFITSALVFSYWAFIAKTVYESFMNYNLSLGGLRVSSIYIIILFYVLFFCSFGVAKLIRRLFYFINKARINVKNRILKFFIWIVWKFNPFIEKPQPTIKSRIILFSLTIIICLSSMIYFLYNPLPWTNFPFTFNSMILAIPLLIVFAFGMAGFRYTCYIKNGFFVRGWLLAIISSLLFSLITINTSISPDRHFEYLMAPIAIIAAYGLGAIFLDPDLKILLSKLKNKNDFFVDYYRKKIKISQKNRLLHLILVMLLLISLAGSVYPSQRALNQSWEEITSEDINSIEWINKNLDKNTTLIGSDHRLERMAEAVGFNSTKDEIINLWATENISEYIEDLLGVGKNYSVLTHVIVDDIMKNEGVHIGPKDGKFRTIYMTNQTWTAAYDKFNNTKEPIFNLIYRNETSEKDPITHEALHWTEIYEINWTYVNNFYLPTIK